MGHRVVMWIGLAGCALACTGVSTPGLRSEQVAVFAEQVRGAEALPAVTGAKDVIAATFAPEVGMVSPACGELLSATLVHGPPNRVNNKLLAIFGRGEGGCPPTCADLEDAPLRAAEPWLQTAIAGEQCDAKGPDPVFAGPLAGLRASVRVADFAMLRALLDPMLRAASGTEHERAIAAAAKVTAIGYALRGPIPSAPADKLLTSANVDKAAVQGALQSALDECTEPGHARGVYDPSGALVGTAPSATVCARDALESQPLPASKDAGYFVVDVWTG